jgi:hypothetical protein
LLFINEKNRKGRYKMARINKDSTKEVVLEAVKKNGDDLGYASEELRNDFDVVLEAVKKNGIALGYASDRLKKNKDIIDIVRSITK